MLLFVAIEPEGKDGHFIPVFKLFALREQKKVRVLPRPQAKSSPSSTSSSSSSSNSQVSITPDRNVFKERQLYQSL